MKFFIILFIFFSFLFYIFESIFNRITMGPIIEARLKKNQYSFFGYASILMLPLGGIIAILLNLFMLIPIFNHISFLPLLMLIGCILITCLELGFGYLLNIKLKLKIWDYSDSRIKIFNKIIPLNFLGQIDFWHSFGWFFITVPIFFFSKILQWLVN